MQKQFAILPLFLVVTFAVHAQVDTVINRYRAYLLQNIQPNAALVRSWTTSPGTTKQWPDIPYDNGDLANWQVSRHLERIRDLAVAWANPRSAFYHQETLFKTWNAALDHWLEKRYQNTNWWHNQIGVPQYMRDIITILRDTLHGEQLKRSLEVMGQLRVQQSGGGANLVWSANLGFHYGALTKNRELMQRCRSLLLNEITITTNEGIQPDYSFHQHGQRLQMYQYGSAFLLENIRIAWLLRGTDLAYPEDKLNILKDLVLKGWQWMARGIHTVPGTIDRSVSRIDALQHADIRKLIPYLCDLWPKEAQQFKTIEAIQNGQAALSGYRYYPYSDFTAYHHKNFSFFLKTISTRTLPTESINSENLKGHLLHSGDGYVVKSGNEYFNLMPVWDWEKLPGITSFKGAYKIDRKPFVGGVSNGVSGLHVMDYRLEDKEQKQAISARKFWASHNNLVVCLIAALTADSTKEEVYTTLDQCRWRGEIAVNQPGRIIKEGIQQLNQVSWIYHSGIAYLPLKPERISLKVQRVSGTWKSINNSLTDARVTEKVFMPVIRHGDQVNNLSSGYVLASCSTAHQTQLLAHRPSWKILRNDTNCQAVSFTDGTIMAAFFLPGSLHLKPNRKITVDKPCLVLIAGDQLYASDPLHKAAKLTVQLNKLIIQLQLPDFGFSSAGALLKSW